MAFDCRHDRLPLRVGAVVMLVAVALCAAPARAQSRAPGAATNTNIVPLPGAARTAPVPRPRVLDIRVVGNRTISREKVLANIGTKIDQPFDQATLSGDVRKLVGKSWFVHVDPQVEQTPGGVIINLRVVERPTLEYVKYLGWKKIKPKTLAKQTGLKKGRSTPSPSKTRRARLKPTASRKGSTTSRSKCSRATSRRIAAPFF